MRNSVAYNGNLLSDGTNSYQYRSDNRLAQSNWNWLGYDPLDRFAHSWYNNDGFDYDGHDLITHRSGSTGPVFERYVHGPGADEPLMAIAADGSNRRFLHADERGSIVAVSDASGNVTAVNRYDEYGAPASGNSGFFQYAGQPWLANYGAQLYYSRARMYDPRLGRFLQPDPIGYGDGMNMYAYVRGDPVNRVDPTGLKCEPLEATDGTIDVCGDRLGLPSPVVTLGVGDGNGANSGCAFSSSPTLLCAVGSAGTAGNAEPPPANRPITVTGRRVQPPPPRQGNPFHRYGDTIPTLCPAPVAFARLREPGNSAPGAPRARDGFTPRIVLSGGNPISQYVSSEAMVIINTTLSDHVFSPGTVRLEVTPQRKNSSDITYTGTGLGDHPLLNEVVGHLFFGTVARSIAQSCAPGFYAPLVP